MKFIKIFLLTLTTVCFVSALYARDDIVKVNFTIDELAFSINVMNTIELRGDEVMPFMEIRDLLVEDYKDVSSGKKKTVKVEFKMPMAKNFLIFMQRAKFKGSEASIFNDISNKMVEAIKKKSED